MVTLPMVQEELRIAVALICGLHQPVLRRILILSYFFPLEVQLSENILSVLIPSFGGLSQTIYRPIGILFHDFSFEVLLAHTIGGAVVAVFSGGPQPVETLLQITDLHIIGEEQLSESVLRRDMSLHRRLLQPAPSLHAVWDLQRVIPQELAHEILGVPVAALSQPLHFCDGLIPLLQRQCFVANHIPQCPVTIRGICELLRLIILLDTNILKTDRTSLDALRLTDDGVLDRPELFHPREWRTYPLPFGIEILHLTLDPPP